MKNFLIARFFSVGTSLPFPGRFFNPAETKIAALFTKKIAEGGEYVPVDLEIVNGHIDERHLDENDPERTGETGILCSIHRPIDPGSFAGAAQDHVGAAKRMRDYEEY